MYANKLLKVYLFFTVASYIIVGSSGRKCYSCTSTPSEYDNDCYSGHANVSTATCHVNDNTCWSRVTNNFDGSFNVSRSCSNSTTSSKDLAWVFTTTLCNEDLCNNQIPHLDAPIIKCYFCTSTPNEFNEECYYGQSIASTTTCEGYCSEKFVNNFDDTFNVTRDCYHYARTRGNNITWSSSTRICDKDLCNNGNSHIETSSTSTRPTTESSKASFSIYSGWQRWWLLVSATLSVFWVTFLKC